MHKDAYSSVDNVIFRFFIHKKRKPSRDDSIFCIFAKYRPIKLVITFSLQSLSLSLSTVNKIIITAKQDSYGKVILRF
ncbi:hypothetical protein DA718_15440 [Klebsiella huaxiensis]|nr:hypothetical protein DA718_15440 [Klebsiella huaxiensis]